MDCGVSLSKRIQREGAPTPRFSFPCSPPPDCSASTRSFAAKRHGICSRSSFLQHQDHVSQTPSFCRFASGRRCWASAAIFANSPRHSVKCFASPVCRNRVISLPGSPVDHHEEHYFRAHRDHPGYEGESEGPGVEEVRNPVGRVAPRFCTETDNQP